MTTALEPSHARGGMAVKRNGLKPLKPVLNLVVFTTLFTTLFCFLLRYLLRYGRRQRMTFMFFGTFQNASTVQFSNKSFQVRVWFSMVGLVCLV
jgi:predicted permease